MSLLPLRTVSRPVFRAFSTSVAAAGRTRARIRPLPPHSSIRTDPKQIPDRSTTDTSDHPLWKFFHNKESLETPDARTDYTGRAWTALELRRKSFEELHQLWYILVREKNVLQTQQDELRRLGIFHYKGVTALPHKFRLVRKSMARIKQVLSERRLASREAAAILRSQGLTDAAKALEAESLLLAEATDKN